MIFFIAFCRTANTVGTVVTLITNRGYNRLLLGLFVPFTQACASISAGAACNNCATEDTLEVIPCLLEGAPLLPETCERWISSCLGFLDPVHKNLHNLWKKQKHVILRVCSVAILSGSFFYLSVNLLTFFVTTLRCWLIICSVSKLLLLWRVIL